MIDFRYVCMHDQHINADHTLGSNEALRNHETFTLKRGGGPPLHDQPNRDQKEVFFDEIPLEKCLSLAFTAWRMIMIVMAWHK